MKTLGCALLIVLGACSSQGETPSSDADTGPIDGPVQLDQTPAVDRPQADVPTDVAPPVPDATTPDSRPGLPALPVLILAGQSNMVGLGYNNELSAADKAPVASATIYYDDSIHPNPNTLKWMPLGPGFGVAADRFGPELSFGRRLRQLWPQRPLAIIKVAEGGTALHDRWAAKTGDLYQTLVTTVQQQLAVLNATAQAGVVGLVWMQGESDGMNAAHAAAYQANLTAFVTALRQDLGLPALPFTAGLISLRPEWPWATTVRAGTIATIAALAPMNVVETADLSTHAADPVHYDSASNLTLGRRFTNAASVHHADRWSFVQAFGPVQGAGAWRYRDRLGASVKDMSWDPTKNRWVGAETGVFIGEGWMHPGPTRSAELVWVSPVSGTVTVELTASAADNTGGDGTAVEVALDATTVWGPAAVPNNTSVTQTLKLVVQKGSLLQLRTSAGPAKDPYYDTTTWQVTIRPGG